MANGPTLNESYNAVLARWAKAGCDASPECEDCGEDLTGKQVFCVDSVWLCEDCRVRERLLDRGPSDEWLRAQERKQMGVTE